MATVLVLGGGFGGIATAVELRERLASRDEVVLVDRQDDFAMGLRKMWHLLGISPLAYGTRHLADLRSRGVTVVRGEIEAVSPLDRTATVDGARLQADAMVIALGAAHAMDAVPGLARHGLDVWTREQIDHARARVEAFRGGRAVVGIFGAPYSCPPGPFELALLLSERLEELGIDADVSVFGPSALTLPLLGAEGGRALDERLAERGITYHPSRRATAVEHGSVSFEVGEPLAFDLLLAVPPHRVPRVLVAAGMARPDGWVRVDPASLETEWAGVYAIGDCTAIGLANGMALPKAGLVAEREGTVAARRIVSTLHGSDATDSFDGIASCFVEMGAGEASEVGGSFYAQPPETSLSRPSRKQRQAKERFEAERLMRWFGG